MPRINMRSLKSISPNFPIKNNNLLDTRCPFDYTYLVNGRSNKSKIKAQESSSLWVEVFMDIIGFSVSFFSRETAKAFEKFLWSDLIVLLENDVGFVGQLNQSVLNRTFLMPMPGSSDFPSIYAVQWYEVIETEDLDFIYSFVAPDWWDKNVSQDFLNGVVTPIFNYFARHYLSGEDCEFSQLSKGFFHPENSKPTTYWFKGSEFQT